LFSSFYCFCCLCDLPKGDLAVRLRAVVSNGLHILSPVETKLSK
jgi:hypothetical protein